MVSHLRTAVLPLVLDSFPLRSDSLFGVVVHASAPYGVTVEDFLQPLAKRSYQSPQLY